MTSRFLDHTLHRVLTHASTQIGPDKINTCRPENNIAKKSYKKVGRKISKKVYKSRIGSRPDKESVRIVRIALKRQHWYQPNNYTQYKHT